MVMIQHRGRDIGPICLGITDDDVVEKAGADGAHPLAASVIGPNQLGKPAASPEPEHRNA